MIRLFRDEEDCTPMVASGTGFSCLGETSRANAQEALKLNAHFAQIYMKIRRPDETAVSGRVSFRHFIPQRGIQAHEMCSVFCL